MRRRGNQIGKRVQATFLLFVVAACAGLVQTSSGGVSSAGVSELSAFPNPFDCRKGTTTIAFTLTASSSVEIGIYSIQGAKLRSFDVAGVQGANAVTWDGSVNPGGKVTKGIYLAVLSTGGAKTTLKIGVIH